MRRLAREPNVTSTARRAIVGHAENRGPSTGDADRPGQRRAPGRGRPRRRGAPGDPRRRTLARRHHAHARPRRRARRGVPRVGGRRHGRGARRRRAVLRRRDRRGAQHLQRPRRHAAAASPHRTRASSAPSTRRRPAGCAARPASTPSARTRTGRSTTTGSSFAADLLATFPDRLREHQEVFATTGGLHAAGAVRRRDGRAARAARGRRPPQRRRQGGRLGADRAAGCRCGARCSWCRGAPRSSSRRRRSWRASPSSPPSPRRRRSPPTSRTRPGITLVGFLRGSSMVVYSRPERVARARCTSDGPRAPVHRPPARGVGRRAALRRQRHGLRARRPGAEPRAEAPHQGEPEGRLRLHELRVAGPGAPREGRVLRERRPRGRVGGHPGDRPDVVLGRALDHRPAGPVGVLAGPAGQARRARPQARRQRPLRPHQLGRRVPAGRRQAARARLAGPGRVLHQRPHGQRDGVRLPAVRARLRHQQPPRLLQHVPRVDGHRDARHGGRREVDHRVRRLREVRPDHRHGSEPRHQPSAHADRARERQAARRDDRLGEPAAGGGPAALQEPADRPRGPRPRHRPGRPVPADPQRRRHGAPPVDLPARPGGGGPRPRHGPRPRVPRRAHARPRRAPDPPRDARRPGGAHRHRA